MRGLGIRDSDSRRTAWEVREVYGTGGSLFFANKQSLSSLLIR